VLQPSKRPNSAAFGCSDGWSHRWRLSEGSSQLRHTLGLERIPATSAVTFQKAKRCHVWLFGRLEPLVEMLSERYRRRPHRASLTLIMSATHVIVYACDWVSSHGELFKKGFHKGSGRLNVFDGKRGLLYKSASGMRRRRSWVRPSVITQSGPFLAFPSFMCRFV